MMKSSPALQAKAAVARPPEQVTLVYRHQDGAHSFSILEVPGLVVLDHHLERAFTAGIKGVSELISTVCNQAVEYETDMTFAEFEKRVKEQKGTPVRDCIVAVPSKIHRPGESRVSA
jgi:hypothetical protein